MAGVRVLTAMCFLALTAGSTCNIPLTRTLPPELIEPSIPEGPLRVVQVDDHVALDGFTVSRWQCRDALTNAVVDCGTRSVWINNDDVNLTFTFDADDMSIERVSANIPFPEFLDVPGAASAWASDFRNPEPTVVIEEFSDQRIRGFVTGSVWNVLIWIQSNDPACVSDDILGWCGEYAETNTPYRIEFDLTYDKLECRGAGCDG